MYNVLNRSSSKRDETEFERLTKSNALNRSIGSTTILQIIEIIKKISAYDY